MGLNRSASGVKTSTNPPALHKLLSTADVAEYLGTSVDSVYQHWREWGVPFFHVGRRLRCRPCDLEAWTLAAATNKVTQAP